MKPSALYLQRVEEFNLQNDPVQSEMMAKLDVLQEAIDNKAPPKTGFLSAIFGKKTDELIKGYYMWGGVGRGKTMLMDIFFECLETPFKERVHFHRFMQTIHQELHKSKNTSDPLNAIADKLSKRFNVLCLDEFHVNDIADAMILGGLLNALFDRGITLLTTSNRPPDDLYKNGLQRERFVPAIEKLKTHTHVLNIDNETDYRLLTLKTNQTYHTPLNDKTAAKMQTIFSALTTGEASNNTFIEVQNHKIAILGEAEGAIWFDFDSICDTNRSQNDYLEIAQEHHSVFISDIPIIDDMRKDAARRFLNLLDVLYDHKVKLIMSAEAEAENLYAGKFLAFEFDRAVSRLIEMQSEEYLAYKHLID